MANKSSKSASAPKESTVSQDTSKTDKVGSEQETGQVQQTNDQAPVETKDNAAPSVEVSDTKTADQDASQGEDSTAPTGGSADSGEGVEQPVAKESITAKKPEPLKARAESVTDVDTISELARILADVPTADQAVVELIKQYVDEMAPNRHIDPARGASLQVSLYRLLQGVINNESAYFEQIFRAVLKLFEIHRNGVFHPTHSFRFVNEPNFNLSKNQAQSFMALVNMFTVTGPAKGRDLAVKTIDFDKTLRYGLTDSGRTRVLSFFAV